MLKHAAETPPGYWLTQDDRTEFIKEFWSSLHNQQNTGSTNGKVLGEIYLEVKNCLFQDTPDLEKAEGLTALAMFLISGQKIT